MTAKIKGNISSDYSSTTQRVKLQIGSADTCPQLTNLMKVNENHLLRSHSFPDSINKKCQCDSSRWPSCPSSLTEQSIVFQEGSVTKKFIDVWN